MGITEYNYPNPKEWTLGNIPGRKQLDKITVKIKDSMAHANLDARRCGASVNAVSVGSLER